MTILFQDNFSTLSNWLLAGTPTLQPSIFTRANALFCKPLDSAYKQFNPLASVYTEGDFYYDTPLVPGQQVIFLHYQGPNGAEICYVSIYVDYVGGPIRLFLYSPFGSQFGSVDIQPNTLVHVGLLYVSGANGGYSAYVNGTKILTNGADTSSQQVNYIYAAMSSSTATTPDVITQDITVSDSYSPPPPPPTTNSLTLQSTIPTTFTVDNQLTPSGQTVTFTPGNHTISVLLTVNTILAGKGGGGVLPWTGIGGDYLINYSNGPQTIWEDNGYVPYLKKYAALGYQTSELGFIFPNAGLLGQSDLDYTKFDYVVNLFASADIKTIARLQNNDSTVDYFVGTQAFIDDWLAFTTHEIGNPNIVAFAIFGEPNGMTVSSYSSKLALLQRFASLVKQIHAIDPNRVVVFPFGGLIYDSAQQWITDLTTVGMVAEPNVIFDILHPYYFENGWDEYAVPPQTPEKTAAGFANDWMAPCVNALGAARCMSEETFAWDGTTQPSSAPSPVVASHPSTPALQERFLTAMINYFVQYNVGFDIWAVLPYIPYSTTPSLIAMAASNYPSSSPTPPTTTTYNFDHFELDGTKIGNQDPATINLPAGQHTLTAVYITTPKTSSKAPLIALTLLGLTSIGAVVLGSNKKGSR